MSTPPTPPSELSLQLVEVHHAFEKAFSRWVQSLLEADCNSSPARMRLLGTLACKGPQIMCGLSDDLGVTARHVTNLVDALEGEGLVQRTSHPTDRRATVIEITPKGGEMVCKMWRPFQEKVARLFDELPEPDRLDLLRVMETLLGVLQRQGHGGKC